MVYYIPFAGYCEGDAGAIDARTYSRHFSSSSLSSLSSYTMRCCCCFFVRVIHIIYLYDYSLAALDCVKSVSRAQYLITQDDN